MINYKEKKELVEKEIISLEEELKYKRIKYNVLCELENEENELMKTQAAEVEEQPTASIDQLAETI